MSETVVILFGKLSANPDADELDVMDEIEVVNETLQSLGYKTQELEFDLNLEKTKQELLKIKPSFVFNIVETIENSGELHYIAPALLESLKIPYSGVSSEHLVLTTNKVLTKEILRSNDINTAEWFNLKELEKLDIQKRYILKPLKEDGSLGIDEGSVFYASDAGYIEKIKNIANDSFFIEEYIDGREFNVSVLGGKSGPEVLPIAEMEFHNFPDGKPKVMGFVAKWKEDSFEYNNTSRTFDIEFVKPGFKDEIEDLCKKCWHAFNSKGYIRIDIRLSKENIPYVIEINGNPCISPGSGFYNAAKQAGYKFEDVMNRIIFDAFN
jgi:D-alanine-D-alanine ligase